MNGLRLLFLLLVVGFFASGSLQAQETKTPLVEVTFDETEVFPGQPLSLRLTVLVPTYLPKPVVFPSFEAPNLMVRLPEGATGPASRRIGSETWSGVTRRYHLSPMIAGSFTIPPQEIRIAWADPDTGAAREDVALTLPIAFSGVVPEGAEGLDPFLAAEALTMSQEVTGLEGTLKPGDSVIRTVTAEIVGTSPMFLPPLLPAHQIQGLAAYPSEPIVAEQDQRSRLSGTRSESVTLIAESGGAGSAPPVSFRWYNLKTGKVETASIDGFDLRVDAPVAADGPPLDRRLWVLVGVSGSIAAGLLFLGLHFLRPRLRSYLAHRAAARLASEEWAFNEVRRRIAAGDFDGVSKGLDLWAARCPGQDPRSDSDLNLAVTALGAARYGKQPTAEGDAWSRLDAALPTVRRLAISQSKAGSLLPPLNPHGPR